MIRRVPLEAEALFMHLLLERACMSLEHICYLYNCVCDLYAYSVPKHLSVSVPLCVCMLGCLFTSTFTVCPHE